MIFCLCGPVGSGKTLRAVRLMAEACAQGRTVVTTIWLDWEKFAAYAAFEFGVRIRPEQYIFVPVEKTLEIMDFVRAGDDEGHPNLVVFDETRIFFGAMIYGEVRKNYKRFLDWVVQSRKDCCDLYFLIQHPKNLIVDVRRELFCEFHHADMRQIALPWLGHVKVPLVPHVVKVNLVWPGESPVKSNTFDMFWPSKALYRCYKTRQKYVDFGVRGASRLKLEKVKGWGAFNPMARRAYVCVGLLLLTLGVGCMRRERAQARREIAELEKLRVAWTSEQARVALVGSVARPAPCGVANSGAVGRKNGVRSTGSVDSGGVEAVIPVPVAVEGMIDTGRGWQAIVHGRPVGKGDFLDMGSGRMGLVIAISERVAVVRTAEATVPLYLVCPTRSVDSVKVNSHDMPSREIGNRVESRDSSASL